MTDFEIIGMLKTYVAKSLVGVGALKGAPCQIQSVVDNSDGTQTVTFLWKDTDGDDHTTEVNLPSAIYDFELLQNGQIIAYDSTAGKWKNVSLVYDSSLNNSSTNAPQTKVVYTALDSKVDKVDGKGLSANDFTDTLKTKLDGIESGAQVNVIEEVQVNGTALTPSGKAVNVQAITGVKKNGTSLTPTSGVVDVEAVDTIAVNGVNQTVTAGAVDLDVETNLITETTWATIQSILS